MKINKIWWTLIEAMVVVAILSLSVVWIYSFFAKSLWFLDWLHSRILAIEIAREWVEAVENIRNTNWLLFPIKIDRCWDVLDYDAKCINDSWTKIWDTNWKEYVLVKKYYSNWRKIEDSKWYLEDATGNNTSVWVDENWHYCKVGDAGCEKIIKWNYRRTIKITKTDNDFLIVTSIVKWRDGSWWWEKTIELNNLLTNYKKDKQKKEGNN